MQCTACGATNPDTAAWCGQCYRRFDVEPETVSVPPPSANGNAPRPVPSTAEGFRRRDDELEWACTECGQFNPMELQRCEVCGTAFVARFRQDAEPAPVQNWTAALAMSVVAPGAGHLAIGRYGTGLARLLLFCSWMLGAVLLLVSGGSGALVVATPLLLGGLALWVLSLIDLYRLSQGASEILAGRVLLWLVVGVLILLVLGLFGSLGSSTPTPPT